MLRRCGGNCNTPPCRGLIVASFVAGIEMLFFLGGLCTFCLHTLIVPVVMQQQQQRHPPKKQIFTANNTVVALRESTRAMMMS